MRKKLFRDTLLASTMIAGMTVLAGPAFAQDTSVDPQDAERATGTTTQDAIQEDAAQEGQEIVVTGTLIRNPNLDRAAPVNVTTSDEIELLQSNLAEEVLREIPGVVPSIGSAVNNGNGGASYVNLRGLGSNRNVVLLDSTRIVPADLIGRVDLNNIPLALLERVDVLTGGASTTYGADAIGGVVNFITKRNFAGMDLAASQQITERGDGNVFRVDLTIGANFEDGRGNAVLGIGYQEADPVFQGARDVSLTTIETFSGTAIGSGTSVPTRLSGARNSAGTANLATSQIDPASGAIVPTFATFNFNPFNVFQTPFERFNIYGAANYEVAEGIEFFTRGLFSKNTVDTIIAPSGAFNIGVNISLNNPFLPAAARNQLCAFDVDPRAAVTRARFTPAECAAAATATGPSDPNYREIGQGGFVSADVNGNGTIEAGEGFNPNPQSAFFRRSVEAGPRNSNYTTTLFDYKAGLRGGLTDNIDYEVFGAYGESENTQTILGYFLNSRVRQSLLVNRAPNGTATCQNTANGCVVANFFGAAGTISPEAVDFLTEAATSTIRTSLAQARGTLSGDFGIAPLWSEDPISFAVGTEYRNYQAAQSSDTLTQSGDLGGAGGATPTFDGGYDVYEGFGELVVPVLDVLTVSGGVRYSSYSVDAPGSPSYDSWTYKGEAVFEPIEGIKFRGNYSRAVRAPNIDELFAPVSTGLTNLGVDPCATFNTAGGLLPGRPAGGPTGELRAVCLAQGATPGNVAQIAEPISGQVLATEGGNLNIRPETSDSYTVGLVVQPRFLPGFTASIDYYNIKVDDAITNPTPGDVIAACFGTSVFNPPAGASTNPSCTSINRDPITGGLSGDPNTSTGLPLALSNAGRLETDGIDLILNYRRDLTDAIALGLSFNGNYTFNSTFNSFVLNPEAVDRECTGFFSTNCSFTGSLQPEYQFTQRTTLTFDNNIDVSLLWRHISSFEQEPLDVAASGAFFSGTIPATVLGIGGREEDFGRISARNYFDLAFRFGITDNFVMTASVQNVLDSEPPITGNNAGNTAFNSGNTFPSTYDALGRRYAVTGRITF
jgi:outer membrane receptor protein involved in Fe transport